MRVGDRFQDIRRHDIHEVTSYDNYWNYVVCIDGGLTGRNIGGTDGFSDGFLADEKYWKYLGNYAKSQNFTNLYDILCENPK